jgi:hypothetical protein
MLVLRLLLVIGVITVAVSMAVYLLSGDKRYLRFSWQLIKFTGVLLFVAAVIMAMGRIILF